LIGIVAVLVVVKNDGDELSYNNKLQAPTTLLPVVKSPGADCAQNVLQDKEKREISGPFQQLNCQSPVVQSI